MRNKLPVITVSFLVLGNCLGVGVLALPIKYGLAGFLPALLGICFIWLLMLISALVIARKICRAKSETFDIPWFFKDALGAGGKWLAIVCNLILLYGVLTAYLSGMSTMVDQLCHPPVNKALITLVYFIITTGLILFGTRAYSKGNILVIAAVWVCFILLVISGMKKFDPALHEAVEHVEADEGKEDIVLEEVQAGYLLNGRLLRPAVVKVGKRARTISDEPKDDKKI